jgi:hypothetical protein
MFGEYPTATKSVSMAREMVIKASIHNDSSRRWRRTKEMSSYDHAGHGFLPRILRIEIFKLNNIM